MGKLSHKTKPVRYCTKDLEERRLIAAINEYLWGEFWIMETFGEWRQGLAPPPRSTTSTKKVLKHSFA